MTRKLGARLERLEQQVGGSPDRAAESREHGRPLWSVPGWRAYGQDRMGGARLAVVGPAGVTAYEVAGVTLEDLS
ncbi:hypothetical protein [Streptomyces sp. NPDC047024]|uniref:hypothetical protein n=1 Tax=Streptomyces sp. NPDC047024 TaxID=3155476 RepID=UPI0033F5F919